MGLPVIKFSSCHQSSAQNFEIAPRFQEKYASLAQCILSVWVGCASESKFLGYFLIQQSVSDQSVHRQVQAGSSTGIVTPVFIARIFPGLNNVNTLIDRMCCHQLWHFVTQLLRSRHFVFKCTLICKQFVLISRWGLHCLLMKRDSGLYSTEL